MRNRLTIDQLEQMKTHELADLLANVVLLLRRLPDIECKNLIEQVSSVSTIEQPKVEPAYILNIPLEHEAFSKKKMPELKDIAKGLNIVFSANIKKDDLIAKILARSSDCRSEQRAIQDL